MAYDQLEYETETLLTYIEKGKEQFERSKRSGIEGDFFSEVKPFADLVRKSSEEWMELAIKWLQNEKPLFINESQIQITFDHIEKISIQSFYPNTSRKKFLSSVQSAQYVLERILSHSKKK